MVDARFHEFLVERQDVIDDLATEFGGYEPVAVNDVRIHRWLRQFGPQDYDLGLSFLQEIQYYAAARQQQLCKVLHKLVVEEVNGVGISAKKTVYVPMGAAGESGHMIAYRYERANRLSGGKVVDLLNVPRVIHERKGVAIVFLDDFVGTGAQAVSYWNDRVKDVVPGNIPLFYAVLVGCQGGAKNVEGNTPLRVVCSHYLTEDRILGSTKCNRFSLAGRAALLRYCRQARRKNPLGYGALGVLVSFQHGTPSNAPSILRGSPRQHPWLGVLPRTEDLR